MKFSNSKLYINLCIFTISLIIIVEIIYYFSTRTIHGANINLVYREIESIDKLIINGFLGHFFRFKLLGVLNILIIPIIIKDILIFSKLENWQKAFLFVYLSILFLVGTKGYFNSRYTLSVYPISIVYLLYSVWNFPLFNQIIFYKKTIPFLLIFIATIYFSKEYYKYKYDSLFYKEFMVNQDYNSTKNGNQIYYKSDNITMNEAFINSILYSDLPDIKFNSKFYLNFPNISQNNIFDIIRTEEGYNKNLILCNNLPSLYLFTDVKAVYYWAGDDNYYDKNGTHTLFENRSMNEARSFLTDSLKIKYIYTYEQYNRYNKLFLNFLKEKCTLIEQNYSAYQLFVINSK